MLEAFFNFLEGPFKVKNLIPFLLGYVTLMWIMFSVWVFIDAKKRYEKTYIAIAFFLLVLPANFPALIFYLIIRPEGEEELFHHLAQNEHTIGEGVNIPIINFVGKEGIDMSIMLKVHNPEVMKSQNSSKNNLNVELSWESEDKDFIVSEKKDEKPKEGKEENNRSNIIENATKKIKEAFVTSKKSLLKQIKREPKVEEKQDEDLEKQSAEKDTLENNNKK